MLFVAQLHSAQTCKTKKDCSYRWGLPSVLPLVSSWSSTSCAQTCHISELKVWLERVWGLSRTPAEPTDRMQCKPYQWMGFCSLLPDAPVLLNSVDRSTDLLESHLHARVRGSSFIRRLVSTIKFGERTSVGLNHTLKVLPSLWTLPTGRFIRLHSHLLTSSELTQGPWEVLTR